MIEDYPRTLLELEQRFNCDKACVRYLVSLPWPAGWVCPQCAGREAWPVRRARWRSGQCHYKMSVTAGTIFQDSHLPLMTWFRAMWNVTSQKNGISALGLQRVLGLGSYKTAWAMLHKLRRAMVRPGRDRLQGVVEVDETYWGGEEAGARGRRTEQKALIIVAAQEEGKGIGRIRLRRIGQQREISLRESHHFFWLLNLDAGRRVVSTLCARTVSGLGSYCIGCPDASTPLPVPHGWASVLSRPALTVGSSSVNLAVCSVPTRKMETPRSSP